MQLICGESTLTLATCGKEGIWSSPVYYVYREGQFFFFSSPQSRHIRQALKSGQAAASLFSRTNNWESIQGLQMQGVVKQISEPFQTMAVLTNYLKRFPFTREFFPKDWRFDPASFLDHFKAKLYSFSPSEIFYLDNRYGFGNRQRIQL